MAPRRIAVLSEKKKNKEEKKIKRKILNILNFGFDTAENEPCKVCLLSVYSCSVACFLIETQSGLIYNGI